MKSSTELFGVTREELRKAGIRESPKRFVKRFRPIQIAFLALFILYPSLIFILPIALFLPKIYVIYKARERRQRIKSTLPFAISHFSTLISLGLSPVNAFSRLSKFEALKDVVEDVMRDYERGLSFEEALMKNAVFEELEEFFAGIVSASKAGSARALEKLGERLKVNFFTELKEKASRAQILLTLHTTLGALIPSMLFALASFFPINPLLAFAAPLISIAFVLSSEVV